jgi:hypothetical protein
VVRSARAPIIVCRRSALLPSSHRFIIFLSPYTGGSPFHPQQLRQQKSFVSHSVLDLFIGHFYLLVTFQRRNQVRAASVLTVPETALESQSTPTFRAARVQPFDNVSRCVAFRPSRETSERQHQPGTTRGDCVTVSFITPAPAAARPGAQRRNLHFFLAAASFIRPIAYHGTFKTGAWSAVHPHEHDDLAS